MAIATTPPNCWDVLTLTQPQEATKEFSDTLSLTREQMTPHMGAVYKKEAMLILLISTFLCRTPHDNTAIRISKATYS